MTDSRRYIAIGDVHGCADSLKRLMEQLDPQINERSVLVFLGDYVDRGPDSRGVIEYLLQLREEKDCIFIRGNHDQMMLDAIDKGNRALWMQNGGGTTLESYGLGPDSSEIPQEHRDFLRNTRLYWDTPLYLFVHGGIDPSKSVDEAIADDRDKFSFMWERSHINSLSNEWEKTVVFGHTPMTEPLIRDRMIGLDTGCVYRDQGYGILSAMILPQMDLIQQECTDYRN